MNAINDFRSSHVTKHIFVNGIEWEYIVSGKGASTILLLPGALSTAESMFHIIKALEKKYRVITPSYNLSQTMIGLCEGIERILSEELADEVHIIGSSYGGLVAQYFVRKFPDKVKNIVLAHSFIIKQGLERILRIASKLVQIAPKNLLKVLLKLKVKKHLINKLKSTNHIEKEFWWVYYSKAIDSGFLINVLIHQNKTLLECTMLPTFNQNDLQNWHGKVLIIESENDRVVSKKDRNNLKSIYPNGEVYTFKDAGHMSFITKRETIIKIINIFLNRL